MAEFCVECWNRLNNEDRAPYEYNLSRRLDLCEGCGEYKKVIIMERNAVELLLYFLWRLLVLPYTLCKRRRSRKNL